VERLAFDAALQQDGSGSGYGDGSGSGSGYGDGDGSGSGYGDPINSSSYWAAVADLPQSDAARAAGAVVALWRSTDKGTPANGGHGTTAAAGLVEEIPGPLQICTQHALHATFNPPKWKGKRLWVVALYGDVQIQEDKIGALAREIIAEIV
jgi:hypothetical protein